MASLALGIAGTALLGPIGGAIGGAIGSYIDNAFIIPGLFPPEDMHGPRIDDLKMTSAKEGTPLNYGMGPECRVGGTILWTSDLIEVKTTKKVGGKGGGKKQKQTQYYYYVDIAVGFNFGKQIDKVRQIYADGKLIYDSDPDVNISSNQLSASKETTVIYDPDIIAPGGGGTWVIDKIYEVISSPIGGPDLSVIKTNMDLTVSGFSNSDLNGTFKVYSSQLFSDTSSVVKVFNDDATIEAAGSTVTLYQDIPAFSAQDITSLTIFDGSLTQTAWSVIEGYEGVGTVPAFRNHAYLGFHYLALQRFGNRIPQFSIYYKADDSPYTIATAIEEILGRCGFSGSEYDTSGVSGNLRGYVLRGPIEGSKALQPIMLAYDILAQEDDGVLKFFSRANAASMEITTENLAAHEDGDDAPRTAIITDVTGYDLPSEVNIDYVDPTIDYQTGSQRERRVDTPTDQVLHYDIPLVMDPVDARKIAKRLLWTPWANRQRIEIQLPPSSIALQENDLIEFTHVDQEGNEEDMIGLVTRIDKGVNGIIQVEAMTEVASALSFDAVAEDGQEPGKYIYFPPETLLHIVDIAPMIEDHATTPGFYLATAASNFEDFWGGGVILESSDNTNYTHLIDIGPEATMGYATTKLGGDVTGAVWDLENTVTVEIVNGTLESVTEEEVLSGMNHAFLGNEIIGYVNATLSDTNTYTLDTLLRGRRDTDHWIDEHTTTGNEPFVQLNDLGVEFISIPVSSIGTTKYYKSIPDGGDETDYDAVTHTHLANTIRPFSPGPIYGYRKGNNDYVVNWHRRTRGITRIFGTQDPPMYESSESYEIDIYSGATIVATYALGAVHTWTYTSAMQTTDGFSPPISTLKLAIYQMSDVLGRGRGRLVTLDTI